MKDIYNKILNDKEIIEIYNQIHNKEDKDKGWAYHDINHVLNVSKIVEKILFELNYEEDFIYSAKIACLLHDVGALEGKENHALRSYIFAKQYFEKKGINFKNKQIVLDAIKDHSDSFDTNNIITLSLIISDKLDVKYTRIAEEGKKVKGNRQYTNIIDIIINIENKIFKVNFITNDKFNFEEFYEYYFTKKIFKAIKSFADKIDLDYEIIINNKEVIQ